MGVTGLQCCISSILPMTTARNPVLFRRIDALEHSWCLRLNRGCQRNPVRRGFALISRLGDGVFWYAQMALLPLLYGSAGAETATRMAIAGVVGVLLYKFLKQHLVRERPCTVLSDIVRGTAPLDRYSFPSGHTLHAVSFAMLIVGAFPQLAWLCIPFAALVALSRVVLGLHYPSDVVAGAGIGAALATAVAALPLNFFS
jgi:undecaprenyl-diphosphatase